MTRLAFVLVLAACGEDHVNGEKLADKIKTALASHDLVVESLSCPPRVVKLGDAFTCTGTTSEKQAITIDVTQQGSGNIEWALHGMELHASKIRSEIVPKVGAGFELKCPHEVAVVAIGEWTQCALIKDGQTSHLNVKIDDASGNESYKVEP
ncbi:MAG TPA: DUF4333 domain-containing protein [Kofleriaceae bacterium]